MPQTSKYKRLKKRGRIYDIVSFASTFIGLDKSVSRNKRLSKCLTVVGTVSSTASFFNYMRQLKHYGMDENPSDARVFGEMVKNVVVGPALCVWGIAKYLSDNNKR